ncbi:hypothetical protein STENM223S_06336 [Streptomyces tendae]
MGEQVEQGAAVGGERLCSLPGARQRADGAEFADQDPADQPVVADDDLAVGAPGGVRELHDVVAGAGIGLAERGEVEGGGVRPAEGAAGPGGPGSGEGEPGQGAGAGVVPGSGAVRREQPGQHAGLLQGGRGQPVHASRVLGAVADGTDVRVRGAQLVVDEDALADVEPRLPGQPGPRPDPAGEHDQVGAEGVAVAHLHGPHRPAHTAHVPHPALGVHLDAEALQVAPHECGGRRVELPLHQPFGLLGQDDLRPAHGQRTGGGHPEEPAPDHHGPRPGPYRLRQPEAVVHRPERVHALGQLVVRGEQTAQGWQHGVGAGGQDQRVVRDHGPVGAPHGPPGPVDAGDPAAQQPGGGREGDHFGAVPSGQHLREQHPVVRAVLLVADQQRGRAQLTEPPGERHTRQSGADHHHTRFRGHGIESAGRVLPGRIPSVSHGERCPQRTRPARVRPLEPAPPICRDPVADLPSPRRDPVVNLRSPSSRWTPHPFRP